MSATVKKNETNLKILLFFGAFCICYNIAIAFHELGHVIAYLIDGAQVSEFVLNPFSWSWAEANYLNHRIFALWGGVTFGQILSLLPLVLVKKVKTALFLFFVKLLAACAFLVNGLYLSAGTILNFGDGGTLVQLGINSYLIISIGMIYLIISFTFWADLQRHIQLDSETDLKNRIKVVFGSITPYMILIILYNVLHNYGQIVMWAGLAIFGILATFLIAALGHFWSRYAVNRQSETVSLALAWKVFSFGLLIILSEFIVFGTPPNPF